MGPTAARLDRYRILSDVIVAPPTEKRLNRMNDSNDS
jgi:hypothetical protein